MERITERNMITNVAESWRQQYFKHGRWTSIYAGDAEDIYHRLRKLDLTAATAADVRAIIGNHSWTVTACDECSEEVTAAVVIGQDERCATVCDDCVRKMAEAIE